MYDESDEKDVMSIAEIRAILDDPESWRGYVYKSDMLPWVHPRNITGVDVERLIGVNRARNYHWWFDNVRGVDYEAVRQEDYEDDDDIVVRYLDVVCEQRLALSANHPDIHPISGVRHTAALLYIALRWESYLSSERVRKADMSVEEIQSCFDLYEVAFNDTLHCHIKHRLLETIDSFFDSKIPADIADLSEFQRFRDTARYFDRVDHLREAFKKSCPEMIAFFARDNTRAAEAAALLELARGDQIDFPEGDPLHWSAEDRAIFYFDFAVRNWFETKWLEKVKAGKDTPFRWKYYVAVWRGLPKASPISDELLNSLVEFTSNPQTMNLLFRHFDEGGIRYSRDTKRTLAYIRKKRKTGID